MIQQRVHRIARTASHGLAGGAGERARRSIRRFGPNEYLEVHNALSQLGVLWLSSPSNDAWVVRVRAWHQFAPDVLDVVIYRARWGTAWLRTGQSAPEMLPGVTGLDEIAALALAEAAAWRWVTSVRELRPQSPASGNPRGGFAEDVVSWPDPAALSLPEYASTCLLSSSPTESSSAFAHEF